MFKSAWKKNPRTPQILNIYYCGKSVVFQQILYFLHFVHLHWGWTWSCDLPLPVEHSRNDSLLVPNQGLRDIICFCSQTLYVCVLIAYAMEWKWPRLVHWVEKDTIPKQNLWAQIRHNQTQSGSVKLQANPQMCGWEINDAYCATLGFRVACYAAFLWQQLTDTSLTAVAFNSVSIAQAPTVCQALGKLHGALEDTWMKRVLLKGCTV